ncbi:MAG TPA: hypothetical protein VEC06_12035 [Paucimonas sp.]|nr:hypothetical protein [Paucimonas sp.]
MSPHPLAPPALAALVAAALALAGCSTSGQSRIGTAATTPLSDLNIVRADIHPVLEQAKKEPYALPSERGCADLAAQIGKLDEALGPDLDAPPSESEHGLLERGGDTLEDSAIGAFQRTAEGVIPFRSWIRKLTGADQHARHLAAANAAGIVRRAFLKGIGAAQGCPPATQSPVVPADK